MVLKSGSAEGCARISLLSVLCALSVLGMGVALQISHGFFHPKALVVVMACIALCALALCLPRVTLLLPFNRSTAIRRTFLLLLVGYFVGGIVFLRMRHRPIDVLILENDSAHSLLHGIDPYGKDVTHQDIYSAQAGTYYGPGVASTGRVRLGFPYPPLTLLWILPGYIVGDVRYSFLLAVALASLMMFYSEPGLNGFLSALLFLFVPDTLFVLTYGWTEPLMVMTLAATIFTARKAPRWLPIALGFFFASKQYSILALPLIGFLLPRFSWKAYVLLLAKAGAVGAAITLPFVLWDPRGFWWSLVGFRLVVPLRLDALSFSALLGRHGLPAIPEWFVMLAVLMTIVFALKKAPKTPAGLAVSLGLVSLVFFVLNIGAFCNYYFFCAAALCLGISSTPYDSEETFLGLLKVPPSAVHNDTMGLPEPMKVL
jgi:hypothetical protein